MERSPSGILLEVARLNALEKQSADSDIFGEFERRTQSFINTVEELNTPTTSQEATAVVLEKTAEIEPVHKEFQDVSIEKLVTSYVHKIPDILPNEAKRPLLNIRSKKVAAFVVAVSIFGGVALANQGFASTSESISQNSETINIAELEAPFQDLSQKEDALFDKKEKQSPQSEHNDVSDKKRMISVAKAELAKNVFESPTDSDRGNGIQKYQKYVGSECKNLAWCASFVSWVHNKATRLNNIMTCSVSGLKMSKDYHKITNHNEPAPGDILIAKTETVSHTGILIAEKGRNYYSIEGNVSDALQKLKRDKSFWNGFVEVPNK